MNKDIRLSTSYFDNPKIKKLARRLGNDAVISHLKLLCWTGRVKPKGLLKDMDEEDIADASQWSGDARQYVEALSSLKLLDRENGHYKIHDWNEHNEYAFYAQERSDKAKRAAEARWKHRVDESPPNPQPQGTVDAKSSSEHCPEHTQAMPPAFSSNAPSPAPSPVPTPSPKRLRTGDGCSSIDSSSHGTVCVSSVVVPCGDVLTEMHPSPSVLPEDQLQKLLSLLPLHERTPSVEQKIKSFLEKEGFAYVSRNIIYANANASTSYRAYLGKALDYDWGAVLKEKEEARKNAEKLEEAQNLQQKAKEEEENRRFEEAAALFRSLPEAEQKRFIALAKAQNPMLRNLRYETIELMAITIFREERSKSNSTPDPSPTC